MKSKKVCNEFSLLETFKISSSNCLSPSSSPIQIHSQISFDICENWEWMLSQAEEIEQKYFLNESVKLKRELVDLKASSSLYFRSYFISITSHRIEQLNEEEKSMLAFVLDPCKSSKIVSDVIHQYQDEWLFFVRDSIFQLKEGDVNKQWDSFNDSYYEKPYQRNLVGALKELVRIFWILKSEL